MLVIKNVSALHYYTIKMSERFYGGVERERDDVDGRERRNEPMH